MKSICRRRLEPGAAAVGVMNPAQRAVGPGARDCGSWRMRIGPGPGGCMAPSRAFLRQPRPTGGSRWRRAAGMRGAASAGRRLGGGAGGRRPGESLAARENATGPRAVAATGRAADVAVPQPAHAADDRAAEGRPAPQTSCRCRPRRIGLRARSGSTCRGRNSRSATGLAAYRRLLGGSRPEGPIFRRRSSGTGRGASFRCAAG